MFVNVDSIQVKIEGMNDYLSLGQYLIQAEYSYNKMWSDDTGRNLAGTMSGTLKGIFPKIILQFRKLTKSEIETLIPILDSEQQNFKYYDPFKKDTIEIETYTGDYKIIDKKIIDAYSKNEGFSISFISRKKRA